ncbi:PREDICTED: uncharacterized protein LOC109166926 [Ipomoea nil]|uniref:uncharacterized protein LOC109166926 n=1 Tax=Ipomoea nil TaxID=35883 RepID=UPI000900B260|nr:PREDICTED: uncharacterized protein LOC109166926 [Ipomoea nil]
MASTEKGFCNRANLLRTTGHWRNLLSSMFIEDLKTVAGQTHVSFREACYARGLLDDDKEYVDAVNEASQWASAHALRKLFITLLTSNSIAKPETVWEAVRHQWHHLADDVQFNTRHLTKDLELILTKQERKNYALNEIEQLLAVWGRTLKDFPYMPVPDYGASRLTSNRLIYEELSYDREAQRLENEQLVGQLTDEQRHTYNAIMADVDAKAGGLFFVYGYGGTGKTFLWRALSSCIRSRGEIVLNVASSGIASLLLPSERTAHSRFAIPININEDSTCNIKQGSPLAALIVRCSLIIWDEAPMMHKHCFKALDKTMRDLLRFQNPGSLEMTFGGKTLVLGGDFRQILPVIPKGTMQDIVGATINSSYLWKNCRVLRLTKNHRLRNIQDYVDYHEVEDFAKWIAEIGDGVVGIANDMDCDISIPQQNILHCGDDLITTIVESTFPNYRSANYDRYVLENRAILAPTLDVVHSINEYMNGMDESKGRTYLSCDSVCKSDSNVDMLSDLHTPEFLNGIKCLGIPNHCFTLKVGSPVMLLRNIDHSLGLCNGTRLIITKLADWVIEAKIMCGAHVGTKVLVPRMSLTPSDPRLPFKF